MFKNVITIALGVIVAQIAFFLLQVILEIAFAAR